MNAEKIKIKVLILPHVEIGEMTGDFPGEAQLYYEHFFMTGNDGEERTPSCEEFMLHGEKVLYVNRDRKIALCVTGVGKVSNAIVLTSILSDTRFDFSECFIFTAGCAGGACGYATLGDVVLTTACIDFDLGHTADIREMKNPDSEDLWFYDETFEDTCFKRLNTELTDHLFEIIKDIKLETTENSLAVMTRTFPGQEWASRMPKVLPGSSESGDNYWKGRYGHQKALQLASFYRTLDPYAVCEMEDIALAVTAERFGMLDRMVAVHVVVNMDVFLEDDGPEQLWGTGADFCANVEGENSETLDIFETAMHNGFKVGKAIIEDLIELPVQSEDE